MPAQTPLIFGIGLPHSGGDLLAALFRSNGLEWRHHAGGKLAQSIAFARATGTQPLAQWPNAVGFSGLYYSHKRHLAPLNIQDYLASLAESFPDAYFIHTHRDPADWVAARFWANDGEHRTAAAWHADIAQADLPAYWLEEHAKHAEACATLFAGNARYLDFNISRQSIDVVRKFLKPVAKLPREDGLPDLSVPADLIDAVVTHIEAGMPTNSPPPVDMNFAQQVADFCTQTKGPAGKPKVLSKSAITWTTTNKYLTRTGEPAPLAQHSPATPILLRPDSSDFERAQATLNELAQYDAEPPLHIDMMDARYLGSDGRRNPPHRTIAYNRRTGAKNLTLWPLPGYHTIAPKGAVGGFPIDEISFENKEDRCVWRGNITGRMSPILTPDDREKHSVYHIQKRAFADDPDWGTIIADLTCVPRYNVVKSLMDHPDFDVGLVLRAKWKQLAETPAFRGLCTPMMPRAWFHNYRYILSLSGNDTGSNFLSAASSNALILKEEDGWELFYTDAFKPWVHYVPLSEGAQDIEEKLAWARAHPDKSKLMAQAATELYDRFANPNNRAAILSAIVGQLNSG